MPNKLSYHVPYDVIDIVESILINLDIDVTFWDVVVSYDVQLSQEDNLQKRRLIFVPDTFNNQYQIHNNFMNFKGTFIIQFAHNRLYQDDDCQYFLDELQGNFGCCNRKIQGCQKCNYYYEFEKFMTTQLTPRYQTNKYVVWQCGVDMSVRKVFFKK